METLTLPLAAQGLRIQAEPVLALPAETLPNREALTGLRRFHLAGAAGESRPVWSETGIVPALLHAYRGLADVRTDYPILARSGSESGKPAIPPVRLLEQAGQGAEEARISVLDLARLDRLARDIAAGRGRPAPARELLGEAGDALIRELKAGKADAEAFRPAFARLMEQIPPAAVLVPLTPQAPFEFLRIAGDARCDAARGSFRKRLRETAERAMAFLDADRLKHPELRDPGAIRGAMGDVGSRFVNAGALAGMAGVSGRGTPLSAIRRERLEAATAVIRQADGTAGSGTLVHDHEFASLVGPLTDWRLESSEEPCETAARRFDETAEGLAQVVRAERLARLEVDGIYDPDRHDPWLARIDWRAFSREELAMLPPVAALVSADHLARRGLPSLSRLLLSGRPVQVLVLEDPARNPGVETGSLAGFRFEPGYLGLSHREAFVQQTSVARPIHMMEGFRRALAGTRAALHVIASGSEGPARLGSWLVAGAALEARAHPFFHYDPEAGTSWARRLDFTDNPHPEADWPVYELAIRTEAGAAQSMPLAFTFVDFALLHPAFAPHFRLVPAGVPEADLVMVEEYLRFGDEAAAGKVPFVWAVDGEGRLIRLAVTLELALAARDRLDTWRILQELAGIRNEYVEEAARKAREESDAKARLEREEMAAAQAVEIGRVRQDVTEDLVTQLTAAILDVDQDVLAAPASPLEALRGLSVDEVAAALLEAADLNRPEETSR